MKNKYFKNIQSFLKVTYILLYVFSTDVSV